MSKSDQLVKSVVVYSWQRILTKTLNPHLFHMSINIDIKMRGNDNKMDTFIIIIIILAVILYPYPTYSSSSMAHYLHC